MTDWPLKTLGEVCEVFDDGDWIESKDQSPSGVRLIQTGNVGDGVFKDRSDKARFISESTFSRLRCTEIFPGDLLVSRLPDPVGRACLIPDTGSKMITAVDCTIMRPHRDIMSPQFLVSSTQTSSYREQVRAKITGTTRDRISRSHLAEVQVIVPPLEEQKRIVELLDAATAHVTELTACYEQARTHASDLFSSASRGAFKGNPDWTNKTIGDVCDLVNGATPDTKVMDYWGGKHAWITPAEMGGLDSPFLSISRRTLSDKGLASCSATLVPPNTVILSSRAPIGHLVINEVPMATNQGCKSLIPKDGLDFSFLYYYLKANVEYLESLGTGTTFKELSGTQLKTVGIPVPSLEEQRKIVARLDSMRAKTSEMVAAYDAKLTAAKNLRQSILEAAFAGEL